ncbi:hypothetical protein BDFB_007200, partial [Asbolus verrucosus]
SSGGGRPGRTAFCDICNKTFSRFWSLQRHLSDTHYYTPQNLQCDVCGRSYRSRNSLVSHRSGGADESRQFGEVCKICRKVLRNKITLRRHVKDLHYAQTEEFWCKICNRCYRTKNSLVVHTCNYHHKKN